MYTYFILYFCNIKTHYLHVIEMSSMSMCSNFQVDIPKTAGVQLFIRSKMTIFLSTMHSMGSPFQLFCP